MFGGEFLETNDGSFEPGEIGKSLVPDNGFMVGDTLVGLCAEIAVWVEFGIDALLGKLVDKGKVSGAFFIDCVRVDGNGFLATNGLLKMMSDVGFTASRYAPHHDKDREMYSRGLI